MLIAELFIAHVVRIHGRHPVSTDGGGTWDPQACRFFQTRSPYPFLFGEKLDRKKNAVYQGQNRKFRRLLSM